MNCQGLSNQEKRFDTLNFLRLKHVQFTSYMTLILQLKKKNIFIYSGDSNVISVFFSSQARGVAILFNNNFEFKVKKTVRDEKW